MAVLSHRRGDIAVSLYLRTYHHTDGGITHDLFQWSPALAFYTQHTNETEVIKHLKTLKRSLVLLFVCLLIMNNIAFAAQGETSMDESSDESTESVESVELIEDSEETDESETPTDESETSTDEPDTSTDEPTIIIESGIAADYADRLAPESEALPAAAAAEPESTEEMPEDAPSADDDIYSAKNYVNYSLMPGDSEYLELDEALPSVYAEINHDNYEQIVYSSMDWKHLSAEAQAEVDAVLNETAGMSYLDFLQEAVFYTLDEEAGVVGSACFAVQYDEDLNIIESSGVTDGIKVASIIAEAGLSDVIRTTRPRLMMASFAGDYSTDSKVSYVYGTWGNAYIYRGTTTGTLGPIYVSSPFGDVASTYISGTLHTGYFYSSYEDDYYYSYCMSARSVYPGDKWVKSDGAAKWNALSEWQRVGLTKALMYGEYYRARNGGTGAYSAVQCIVWSIMHQQMDQYGQGTGNIYDGMYLYDAYYSDCWSTFAKIRDAMWIHGDKPTFTYNTSATANANPVTLTYDAATGLYTAKLKDTGYCSYTTYRSSSLTYLEEYFTFTAVDDNGNTISGIKFSADDDTLTVTATAEALALADVITVKVLTPTRTGTNYISVFDSIRYLGEGWQPIITNWEDSGSPTYVYMSIKGAPKDPEIDTSAADSETGSSFSLADKSVTIVDTVSYKDLEAGQSYTVSGTLMDKATGRAVTVNGSPVTASTSFAPSSSDGTVKVKFTFDGSALAGKTLVVFEKLYRNGTEVAKHEDLTDAGQTIYLPKLSTTALDSDTGTHEALADSSVTIRDSISYVNLIPGKSYTVTGTLMDKSTGSSLRVNNKAVTATLTFTPSSSSGSVKMTFTFDGSACYGKEIVVYESLSYNGKVIAEHKSLSDADQTVSMSPAASLSIKKLNADGKPMSGVTFALTDSAGKAVKDASGSTVKNLTTDNSGTVRFGDLPYGDYRLTEVSTKNGYSLMKDSIAVTFPLSTKGQVAVSSSSLYDASRNTTYLFDQSYEIKNGEAYKLPATGSAGFTFASLGMTVLGLTLAATIFYIFTYERKSLQ